jgi:uncharacterized repeat protein (TIGR01451 family)
MTVREFIGARARGGKAVFLLLTLFAVSLGASSEALAIDCVADAGGIIDGFVNYPVPPPQINLDGNCRIQNYTAANPMTSNFSFDGTLRGLLIIFDNVVFTGNMSCNASHDHKLWFVNGSTTTLNAGCQNILIPVEKIDKANPPGPPFVTIGVPFTWTLTIPVLFDPATGTVINFQGSVNDLHSIKVTDDLNATGVDLTVVGPPTFTWLDTNTPVVPPPSFTNVGNVLTFDNFPIVTAGRQFAIALTVVLNNNPAVNTPGKQFINTAKWDFGRLIDGTFYEPLPGEWGITPPLTISGPVLTVDKDGPATMNLGQWGDFTLDVQNTGLTDAWDVSLRDLLPDGPTGGMCDLTPQILSARVFAADGITTIPGKGPLVQGTDYTFTFTGPPACRLDLTTQTAQARIGASERLIVQYRTQLDANTQDGVALTNVAGAIQWFNGDDINPARVASNRVLTNGTVGVVDHEDAHTVNVDLFGYFFEKTVANQTSGANPATTAAPGDTLRYTLRFQTTDQPLANFRIDDVMDALNAAPAFVAGSLAIVSVPPGADVSNTNSTGGPSGTGVLDVRNLSLPLGSQLQIVFDITLRLPLANGTVVTDQATFRQSNGTVLGISDDPGVSGQADPFVAGDEDPTRVTIVSAPALRIQKISTDLTADPAVLLAGETLRYTLTVVNTGTENAVNVLLRDAVPPANTTYVAGSTTLNGAPVADVAGLSPLVNGILIHPPSDPTPGSMPADPSASAPNVATITFDVVVSPAAPNNTVISNQGFVSATGIVNQPSDDPGTPAPNDPTLDIVNNSPDLVVDKSGPATMSQGQWGNFTLDVQNNGMTDAWDVALRDLLPDGPTGGMCDLTPEILNARVFAADGVTPVPGKGPLVAGTDYTLTWSGAPACQIDMTMLTAAGRIGPNERLIVGYRTQLDAGTQDGVALTNVAGAIQWFNGPASNPVRIAYNRTLTNGTVGVLDHEDAHTVTVDLISFIFEKTVANLTSGANPATTAAPGDTLRYTLRVSTTDQPIVDFRIFDEMDNMNPLPDFVPGTLALVTVPPGADVSNTSANGGANGTGVLDIRNLNLAINSQLLIVIDITLKPALANGTVVTNQSPLRLSSGTLFALSDDPNVNGPADPLITGDEDPTRVAIVSAPAFRIQKISTDLTGDPNVLLAGETLRYTITVANIGDENAVNTVLRDAVPPVNTTYVAGSTTLNGAPVADVAGLSPLVNGLLIHPPGDPTPGSMPADPSASAPNVATITFTVVVSPAVPNGTVISNQGFVSAVASGIIDQPSDDPDTPIPDDPTRDIVGNLPLLYATKTVALSFDQGTLGVVDPGDRLLYTITVQNSAATPATGVVLTDGVPANTTYFADSTRLNGLPVGQPDGGVSPLASGIDISSSDLTPPLPGAGAGTISPGEAAVLQFELVVNLGTPAGTLITNQAVVNSVEVPNLLTDGDGNPANGPQPTVVVVGAVQQLAITKQVTVVGGGPALAGATLDYVVTVTNIAPLPALSVVITDTLPAGQLVYVAGSGTMNGLAAGVSVVGQTITADYAATYGALAPGGVIVLRFRAVLNPGLANGTVVTNTGVVAWNTPTQTASASVSISVGGLPGLSVLSGSAWHDADFDDVQDPGERVLTGWTVELYRDNVLWNTVLTNASGAYLFAGVDANDTTAVQYEVRFRAPGAGANTALLGLAASPFTNNLQRISAIVVPPGTNVQGLNLPIDPNGVVYNSMARTPIAGATLTLLNAGSGLPLPASCFPAGSAQQGQVTLADGWYKFDVTFGDPACPIRDTYLIDVTTPGTYVAGYSQIIPPTSGPTTPPYLVPACPGGTRVTVGAVSYCQVQPSELAPPVSVPPASAIYRVHMLLDSSPVDSSQLYNNHIPLDPQLNGALAIAKTSPLLNVSRGQLVPYTITVNNVSGLLLTGVSLVDRVPAGLVYVAGSARLDGVPVEPAIAGLDLRWNGLDFTGTQVRTLKLLLAVGPGVSEGEYVNRALAVNATSGLAITGEATATVRVMPDPDLDCTDVTGKVWNDVNRNGKQEDGEEGLPGVRLATPRGLQATTDAYGRYHITCAIVPNESRGSNFVVKLDDRTLPSGFRLSTDQVAIKRATRGRALKVNFAASIHRVVAIDLSDAAFEPGTTDLRVQWRPRIDLLIEELRKAPSVLRLSYLGDTEESGLVARRVDAIKRQVNAAWAAAKGGYPLSIEPEIFWRRGAPPKKPEVPAQESRR